MNNSINCPRCSGTFDFVQEEGTRFAQFDVLECKSCHGKWFSAGELENHDQIHEVTALEFRRIPRKKEQYKELNCPVCTEHPNMDKVIHERDKKVIMDVCPSCEGVWLDSGELEAIQKESLHVSIYNLVRWFKNS